MRKKLTKKEKQARAALREIERKLEAKLHEIHDARNREVGMYIWWWTGRIIMVTDDEIRYKNFMRYKAEFEEKKQGALKEKINRLKGR